MMRIATPETVWPRHFFNRLNKMQTRASKINALPINGAKNDEIPDNDPLAPPGVELGRPGLGSPTNHPDSWRVTSTYSQK